MTEKVARTLISDYAREALALAIFEASKNKNSKFENGGDKTIIGYEQIQFFLGYVSRRFNLGPKVLDVGSAHTMSLSELKDRIYKFNVRIFQSI